MSGPAWAVAGAALALAAYAYAGYPLLLTLLARRGRAVPPAGFPPGGWPEITVVVPVYNEAPRIAATLEGILAAEYPGRRHVLVVSDASTDGTGDIVARYPVDLLRLTRRGGKTAAENAAAARVRGDIVVQTDASVALDRGAIRELVAAFADPGVGVASGRDVSVASVAAQATRGESAYVGYEMWVRGLETRAGGIVGASGCLYAQRAELLAVPVPEHLSRDFAAPLLARQRGWRAVSVERAICYVPRSPSLAAEYRRKVRTMARGLRTLWHFRALLVPRAYGRFAWMLASHKPARWLVPWAALGAWAAVLGTAARPWPAVFAAGAGGCLVLTLVAAAWPAGGGRRVLPRVIALPGYITSGTIAALHAWVVALFGSGMPAWEPTRRPASPPVPPAEHHRQGPEHDLEVAQR